MHPNVVFQPHAQQRLQAGIHQIVAPIRVTLGPLARHVINEETFRTRNAEIIDNGGIIARRILQLPDRDADMGAMLVRHMVTRLYKEYGDCTATAAVLFQTIFDEGLRVITAGIDAMSLRQHLLAGAEQIDRLLADMVAPAAGKDQLSRVAESLCHDAELAQMLGEIFDVIGEYGRLDIRRASGRALVREYVDGAYWEDGLHSPVFLSGGGGKPAELMRPALLLTDLMIQEAEQLESTLYAVRARGAQSLVIVAQQVSDRVIAVLHGNALKFPMIAVKTPGGLLNRQTALEDLAALTGGRLFLQAAGDDLSRVTAADLGMAQRFRASLDYMLVVGGASRPADFRHYVAQLRTYMARAAHPSARDICRERIGRLMGGSVTLRVGAFSDTETRLRQELAERTATSLRAVVRSGVLPGGGVALLACQEELRQQHDTVEERAAVNILRRALETPLLTIADNSGYDSSTVLARLRSYPQGYGFDAHSGRYVPMLKAGIVDVADAYRAAVRMAITSAAQALTISALVHCKNPEQVLDPA